MSSNDKANNDTNSHSNNHMNNRKIKKKLKMVSSDQLEQRETARENGEGLQDEDG